MMNVKFHQQQTITAGGYTSVGLPVTELTGQGLILHTSVKLAVKRNERQQICVAENCYIELSSATTA